MGKHKEVLIGGTGEIVEKKSRFIANVRAVKTVEEAQTFIEEMKKKYWDARHNCSAFSVGEDATLTRSSDDGEPSGTAGKPILEVINGSEVKNIAIVVTRYFGGTLLGTGGLVRAYTEAARAGLSESVIVDNIPGMRISIATDYTDLGKIQYILANNDIFTEETEYTDKVIIHTIMPLDEKDRVEKLLVTGTCARAVITEGEILYYAVYDGEVKINI